MDPSGRLTAVDAGVELLIYRSTIIIARLPDQSRIPKLNWKRRVAIYGICV